MTKQRFTKCDTKIRDNGEEMSQAEVRDMLNAQHEEITQLKIELDKTIEMLNKEINSSEKAFDGLLKENQKLKEANQGLQFKIIDMLDFIKSKGSVTRQEIKEWWNKGVME